MNFLSIRRPRLAAASLPAGSCHALIFCERKHTPLSDFESGPCAILNLSLRFSRERGTTQVAAQANPEFLRRAIAWPRKTWSRGRLARLRQSLCATAILWARARTRLPPPTTQRRTAK